MLLSLFFLISFALPPLCGEQLAFFGGLRSSASIKCSVGVVPHTDVFFDIFVGSKVISISYSSAILKVPPGASSFP